MDLRNYTLGSPKNNCNLVDRRPALAKIVLLAVSLAIFTIAASVQTSAQTGPTAPAQPIVSGLNWVSFKYADDPQNPNTFDFYYKEPDGTTLTYEYTPGTKDGPLDGSTPGAYDGTFLVLACQVPGGQFLPSNYGGFSLIAPNGTETFSYENSKETFHLVKAQAIDDGNTLETDWTMTDSNGNSLDYSYTFRMTGRTLTIHAWSTGGSIGVSSGGIDLYRCEQATSPVAVGVPYLTLMDILHCNGVFCSMYFDWEKTAASTIIPQNPVAYNDLYTQGTSVYYAQKAGYLPLTNGTRAAVDETIYLTVSPTLTDVLPTVPNPQSPYKALMANYLLFDNFQENNSDFAHVNSAVGSLAGICKNNLWVIVHNWQKGFYDNMYPDVLPANGCLGGDDGPYGLKAVSQTASENGYLFALHENYRDFYTDASSFNTGDCALDSSTHLPFQTWSHSLSINLGNCQSEPPVEVVADEMKPTRAAFYASQIAPQIHSDYTTSAAFLDVHSSVNPSECVDYDSTVSDAGSFRGPLSAYRSLFSDLRVDHNGPVSGEGYNHMLYLGYIDDVEAQIDTGAGTGTIGYTAGQWLPLLVDFDLLKLHSLTTPHGVGYYERFYTDSLGNPSEGQNIYVADYSANKIDVIAPDGTVTALASGLNNPFGIAADSWGDVFVSDDGTGNIYEYTPGVGQSIFATAPHYAHGLACDSAGDLYVANFFLGTITEITPGKAQSTFASSLSEPNLMTFDSQGNMYVACYGNGSVVKITPDGKSKTTVASGLRLVDGTAVDGAGNVFVSQGTGVILKFPAGGGPSSTFASGLGGGVNGMTFDSQGNLIVSESSSSGGNIYKFTVAGVRSTLVSGLLQPIGLTVGPTLPPQPPILSTSQVLEYMATELAYGHAGYIPPPDRFAGYPNDFTALQNAATLESTYIYPAQKLYANANPVTILYHDPNDSSGTVMLNASDYINKYPTTFNDQSTANFMSQVQVTYDNGTVVCVNRNPLNTWTVTVPAGYWVDYNSTSGLGTGTTSGASYTLPVNCGWVVFSPTAPCIPSVDATIETVAGDYKLGGSNLGNGGPATSAGLNMPNAITFDASGNMFIADIYNYAIREVSGGIISTVPMNGELDWIDGVAVDANLNLYVADGDMDAIEEYPWVPPYDSTPILIDQGVIDKPALPLSLTIDGFGNLYYVDEENNRVDEIDSLGSWSAVPSDPRFNLDSYFSTTYNTPYYSMFIDVASSATVDSQGNIYIADVGSSIVWKVDTGGYISAVAGNGTVGYSGDCKAAVNAQLSSPSAVAVDSQGNLYIADTGNSAIRVVSAGVITTFCGNGHPGYFGDGTSPTGAALAYPSGLAFDSAGNLYISDTGNNVIRKVTFNH